MRDRFRVICERSETRVVQHPDGEHRSFRSARAAAVEHLEELTAGAAATLWVLRRAASHGEYAWLLRESGALRGP